MLVLDFQVLCTYPKDFITVYRLAVILNECLYPLIHNGNCVSRVQFGLNLSRDFKIERVRKLCDTKFKYQCIISILKSLFISKR